MSLLGSFLTQPVTIIRNEGTPDEERHVVEAHIQSKKGFFAVETPIYEGDIVEVSDPRGGMRRVTAKVVAINDLGISHGRLNHITVTWGKPPAVRVAAVRRLDVQGLHPSLQKSNDLFTDGHFGDAIFNAFRAVEIRVAKMSGLSKTGQSLMISAFDENNPLINVSKESGQTGRDERLGFKFLFAGALSGIRNPKAHSDSVPDDPQRTLEYLAFASLLMRRLDDAESP